MQFSEVIGQEPVKEQLRQMVLQNRVSHAQLFLAAEGTGGLPLALAFAQYMVCEKVQGKFTATTGVDLFGDVVIPEPLLHQDACGVCNACVKAAQMIHPDIHYSYPVFPRKPGDKPKCTDFIKEWRTFVKENPYGNIFDWLQHTEAENKQGNITKAECDDIIHKLSLKSFESEYKILVMWGTEFLGLIGNSLLKLIEEPPPNTLFIFVAEDEDRILQTILSRTQLIKLAPLQPKEIEEELLHRGIDNVLAVQLSLQAQGNFHEALNLIKHADGNYEEELRVWLNTIATVNLPGQVKWIENMAKQGREVQKQFLQFFIHLLQRSVRLNYVDEKAAEHNDMPRRINKLCDVSQQLAIVAELEQAIYYVERNANVKMLFHALTIKIYHIIKHRVVPEVM